MRYFDGSTTTTTGYTYNDLNQLTVRDLNLGYTYSYDDNGNMTEDEYDGNEQRSLTWNDDNRLTYLDNIADDDEVEYTYDPMGRRIMRKDVDNNTYTCYYYDGLTVIAERKKIGAGSWSYSCYYTTAPGVIGNVLFRSSPEVHFHYDALGNVVFTSLSDSTPATYFDQEAYGNVKAGVGTQSGYHLTTKEYDSIPELYYFWQRWYDPVIGVFISKDRNTFSKHFIYCSNNPLNKIDPFGLLDTDPYPPPYPVPTPVYDPYNPDFSDPYPYSTCPTTTPPTYSECFTACVEAGNSAGPTTIGGGLGIIGLIRGPGWLGIPGAVHVGWTSTYCAIACIGYRSYGEWH